MGSTQRRSKNACLQHGSLIINQNYPQQPASDIEANVQTGFDLGRFIHDVARQVGQGLHLKTQAGLLGEVEKEKLPQLQQKYRSEEWNAQR